MLYKNNELVSFTMKHSIVKCEKMGFCLQRKATVFLIVEVALWNLGDFMYMRLNYCA